MKRWLSVVSSLLLTACTACQDGQADGTGAVTCKPGEGAAAPARVMPLGDSITLGVNGGYRRALHELMVEAERSIDFVGTQSDPYAGMGDREHEGHPGFNIGDITRELDGWLSQAQPDVILLMIGTNDIAWWSARSGAQIGESHAALVDAILAKRPDSHLVVSSIPPITSKVIEAVKVDRALLAEELNASIRTSIDARTKAGKRVRFVDVHAVLSTQDLYDGVHPSEAAHARIARRLAPVLEALVPRCD